jgi:hypothetical protein
MTQKTKAAIATGVVILLLVATALIWRKYSTPPLKDSDFFVGDKSPPNLVVIRPTHFVHQDTQREGTAFKNAAGKYVRYIVGRNVSFQEMIEDAYGTETQFVSEARIVFPPNLATKKFDYLVTMPEKPEEHLQAAIKKQLGYSARWEMRNTDALALKLEMPNAPGLQISTNTVRKYKGGNFTHYKVGTLIRSLEFDFKQPVLNETGLTNFYNFYWSFGQTNQNAVKTMLANLGLGIGLTNEPLQMLVVEKVP